MAYTDIDKPTDYFNTVLYTGNGTSQSITGVGFQPDWLWVKRRNNANNHQVFDVIRGTNVLVPNETGAESNYSAYFTSLDSDGFTFPASSANLNASGGTYASWNWLAGGTASSNTDGSITSSVSASTTSGFSIVSYTGTGSNATVGHGLGAVPKIIFFKDRETSVDWGVYAEPNGNTKEMYLSTTDSAGTNTGAFNSTTPTSSVFTIGTSSRYNPSSKGVIAYCFADVKGYSKFGSYTGNGDSSGNGPFIYTGFKPAWIMIKNASTGSSFWLMVDNKRDTFNVTTKKLYANINNGEFDDTHYNFDFLSNGFKLKSTSTTTNYNNSGDTYIYMCFAESPFVTSTGIPTTAR